MSAAALFPLFPACEPRTAWRLPVGDGHSLYVEECGAATGLPVVFLHGGPGSGSSPAQRRLFDPAAFRAILFDQRGGGRSTPSGALHANTTAHLVADMERLREALGVARWIVFGGSWGSLLGLAYAQAHPQRVLGLVLRGIFLGTRQEIHAYARGAGLAAGAGVGMAAAAGDDPLAPWRHRILGADPAVALAADPAADPIALAAVRAWLDYERTLMGEPPLAAAPAAAQIAKARIQMHYLADDCFLAPGQLLAGVERIRHLPAAIVQGLDDPVCPAAAARRLHAAWPEAEWLPLPDAGHGGLASPIAAACIGALERLRQRL